MTWHVITDEGGEHEGLSSALATKAAALSFARDLIAARVEVLRIEGSDGEIMTRDEVAAAITIKG